MKRKEKETVAVEPKVKKVKKSVDFSENVNVKKIPNSQSKNPKAGGHKSGKEKKGKFEKPTASKKPDKFDKTKKFDKNSKGPKTGGTETEKPDWLEFKKQKKELKEKRKAKKLNDAYDNTVKAKQLGEKLRRADCTKEKREQITTELYELLKGQFSKIVFLHDMARIVQWELKYCTPEIRESIVTELKQNIVQMLQSKYAKNCIETMLKHGTDKVRADVIAACGGNVVKLAGHSVAAPIVELAYSSWATEADKVNFKQEFYGDMYKEAKDNDVKKLPDVYKSAENMKSATLSAVRGNLVKIFNKKLVTNAIVHSVLLEYLENCSKDDRDEMIVMIRSFVVELSKSKDGAESAMICLRHGTNKDKKISMKALKGQVKNLALNEHGYMVLITLFDCIDDTVLVKKMILSELQTDLTEIAVNEYGRYVVLYLVARRDPHYFHPKAVEQLKLGNDNATSKKPADVRAQELLDGIIDKFLETVATEAATWLSNSSISMVTLAILKAGDGEKLKAAYEAIGDYIIDPESVIKEDEKEYKVVEYSGLHMMLKKLIQNDKTLIEKEKTTFGEVLVEKLDSEVVKKWIEFNRGCFLLITLIENSSESTANDLITKLKPIVKTLKTKKTPGASILLKKLK